MRSRVLKEFICHFISIRIIVIGKGVSYKTKDLWRVEVCSTDVGVVNLITDTNSVSVMPLPLMPINTVRGAAFNIFNNIWDVNFIFWYPFDQRDNNQKFRFKLNFYKP